MKSERKKLLEKIRVLREITLERGSAPNEVEKAARKAAELMAEFELTEADLEIGFDEFVRESAPIVDDVTRQLIRLARAIADLTDCRHWIDDDARIATRLTWFGRDSDVAIASYLLAVCEQALRSGLAGYSKGTRFYRPQVARRRNLAYLTGMAETMAKSIREIDWVRRKADRESGKGIVPRKTSLVAAALKREGIVFSTASSLGSFDFDRGYGLGRQDGAKVRFDAAVEGGPGVRGLLK